ncbi:MAG TPA: hypothetical protein VHG93_21360, partial [Longimicrobium sp.]|nr:hypothetical protein [Longimicrobium sp.]
MARMTRLTVFLAVAALAAAPPSLRGQNSGGTPGAQPSRRVDECGAPASQSRNRRNTPRPA